MVFSLVQSNSPKWKWRAEIHLAEELEELTGADFAGRRGKCISNDGAGMGDMKVSVYDTDGDGGKNNFGSSLGSRDNAIAVGRRRLAAFFVPKETIPWSGVRAKNGRVVEVEPTTAFCSKRHFGDKNRASESPKTANGDEFASVLNPQPYHTRKAVDL